MKVWHTHRVQVGIERYQCVLTDSCPNQPNATHQTTQPEIKFFIRSDSQGDYSVTTVGQWFPPIISQENENAIPPPHENGVLTGPTQAEHN